MTAENIWNEIEVQAVLADFETGNRVFWWQADSHVLFGNVLNVGEDSLTLELVSREILEVAGSGDDLYDPSHIAGWAKLVDASLLEIGDVLSTTHEYYTMEPGKREFFTVIDMVRGRQIFLQNKTDHAHTATLDGTVVSLDSYLKYWQLEG